MSQSSYLKNLLITLGILGLIGGIGYSGYAWRINQKKAKVANVMKLNICAQFSDTERLRLDNYRLDPYETRRVLLEIHQNRISSWLSMTSTSAQKSRHFQDVQRNTGYGFQTEIKEAKAEMWSAMEKVNDFTAAFKKIEEYKIE